MHRLLQHVLRLIRNRPREKDPDYLEWLHELPCTCCGTWVDIRAHHEPPKGAGGRDPIDYNAVPLCQRHHDVRHGVIAPFDEWTAADIERACRAARLPLLQFWLTKLWMKRGGGRKRG